MKRPIAYIATRLLLFWQKLRKQKIAFDFSSVRTVLCVETSRMGDVVSMIAFFESLHNANPTMALTVAVDARHADILQCVPSVTGIIPLTNLQFPSGMAEARRKLKSVKFDLTISGSPAYRNALLALGTKSRFKIGYFESKTSTTPFLFRSNIDTVGLMLKRAFFYSMENLEERPMKIAHALGIEAIPECTTLRIPEPFIIEGDEVIDSFGFEGAPFVIMHPFSGWAYRNWNLDNYLTLAKRFSNNGIITIIVGSKEDEAYISLKHRGNSPGVRFLFGNPLRSLIGIMKRASLFIGNDSGPLHLATAIGIPCIGLFGPASPALTAPRSGRNVYFYEPVECSPCEQQECVRKDNPCMNLISTEKVAATALALLDQTVKAGY